ncbi:unnamed protein product [Urochloa humidicola]
MAARTRAAATHPRPAADPAPRPPAARRRRQGLPAPSGRVASGRPEKELQEGPSGASTPGSGAERPGGIPAQHGPGRKMRRDAVRDGSTQAAASLRPPAPKCSPAPREVNRPVTRSFNKLMKSTRANVAVANEPVLLARYQHCKYENKDR